VLLRAKSGVTFVDNLKLKKLSDTKTASVHRECDLGVLVAKLRKFLHHSHVVVIASCLTLSRLNWQR